MVVEVVLHSILMEMEVVLHGLLMVEGRDPPHVRQHAPMYQNFIKKLVHMTVRKLEMKM